nr:uncharacterized protein CI109_004803 [Kwoniella shandongensis]KAA5526803.1 hypothetical protein CI109_004803 [Kwoniella shandongensis]
MSLHTIRHSALTPTTLTNAQQKVIHQLIRGHGNTSGSWFGTSTRATEDEGSFWTARGTLRSVVAPQVRDADGDDMALEAEVVKEEEVLVLIHELAKRSKPSSQHPIFVSDDNDDSFAATETETSSLWTYGETPMPSRVLYLFHPPPRLSHTPLFSGAITLDPWSWLDKGREQIEKAFWGLIMPSVSGLVGMGEFLGATVPSLMTLNPAQTSLPLALGDASSDLDRPHLYSQETIYTLRLPVQSDVEGKEGEINLGPTVRPVLVKKRAGMPTWSDRDDGMRAEMGWGRGIGMRC